MRKAQGESQPKKRISHRNGRDQSEHVCRQANRKHQQRANKEPTRKWNFFPKKETNAASAEIEAKHHELLHADIRKPSREGHWIQAIKGMQAPKSGKQRQEKNPGAAQQGHRRHGRDCKIAADFVWKRPKRSVQDTGDWIMTQYTSD